MSGSIRELISRRGFHEHGQPQQAPLGEFCRNRRAFISLIIFALCFVISLFAELIANDRPILVKYRDCSMPRSFQFYSEQTFGGDLRTEAIYGDVEVQCLITTGGMEACWDTPELLIEDAADGRIDGRPSTQGWIICR